MPFTVMQLLKIQYGIESGVFEDITVSVTNASYTVREKRTGRALYTVSGWYDLSHVSPAIADAISTYEHYAALGAAQLKSARTASVYASLRVSWKADMARALLQVQEVLRGANVQE